jgi:hypothetical protein
VDGSAVFILLIYPALCLAGSREYYVEPKVKIPIDKKDSLCIYQSLIVKYGVMVTPALVIDVNVKAKTMEGLGVIGSKDAVAASVAVQLEIR